MATEPIVGWPWPYGLEDIDGILDERWAGKRFRMPRQAPRKPVGAQLGVSGARGLGADRQRRS